MPFGTSTAHVIPAFAAYAAALADVFPVDAQTTAFAPSSIALLIASVIPRSLNDPVGLAPSYFSQTSQPVSSDSGSDRTSGVPPSRSVIDRRRVGDRAGATRYSSMTPRH